VPSALAVCLWLIASAVSPAEPEEAGLAEVQEAAARAAGGTAAEDASRASRARLAHWAPQVRGQAQVRDDEKLRNGEFRLAPLHEQDLGVGHAWAVMLTWDFPQVIYARDEAQLAVAHARLAQVRREAAAKAALLFLERRRARARWLSLAAGEPRAAACLAALQLTAELDAITAGLFHDAVSTEETACAAEDKR
jgi:hypothetical protein